MVCLWDIGSGLLRLGKTGAGWQECPKGRNFGWKGIWLESYLSHTYFLSPCCRVFSDFQNYWRFCGGCTWVIHGNFGYLDSLRLGIRDLYPNIPYYFPYRYISVSKPLWDQSLRSSTSLLHMIHPSSEPSWLLGTYLMAFLAFCLFLAHVYVYSFLNFSKYKLR